MRSTATEQTFGTLLMIGRTKGKGTAESSIMKSGRAVGCPSSVSGHHNFSMSHCQLFRRKKIINVFGNLIKN